MLSAAKNLSRLASVSWSPEILRCAQDAIPEHSFAALSMTYL